MIKLRNYVKRAELRPLCLSCQPSAGSSAQVIVMALQESPEKYVIRTNLVEVTRAVTENLDRVSDRLVEKGFMTVNAAIGIKGTLGTTTSSKASEFMQQVLSKTHNEKREEWFEKFVGILGNDTAEQELVQKLIRDYGKLQ